MALLAKTIALSVETMALHVKTMALLVETIALHVKTMALLVETMPLQNVALDSVAIAITLAWGIIKTRTYARVRE
ncbi:hypothetical protein [Nostoc sp.]|uniref:hypothetical protein n=1 Tax=Nostoc sp. TaxID=1180 RepID=UPI002FF9636E